MDGLFGDWEICGKGFAVLRACEVVIIPGYKLLAEIELP
jgi:hypothetical protein